MVNFDAFLDAVADLVGFMPEGEDYDIILDAYNNGMSVRAATMMIAGDFDDDGEPEGSHDLSDDGDALASAGFGTDEDYGGYDNGEY